MKTVDKKHHRRKSAPATQAPEEERFRLIRPDETWDSSANHQPDNAQEERYAKIDQHCERRRQMREHLGLLDDPEFNQQHQQLAELLKQRHGMSIHQFSELVRIWEYEDGERRADELVAMAEAYLREANKRSSNPPA